MALKYRSLWLSDIHLGTLSCRADELLDFIDTVQADRIYLVGDIIDLQRMKVRPRFPESHLRVIAEFVRLAARGTEVVFIPGNHDHEFRKLAGHTLCGIPVKTEAVHERPNGEKLLVMHGDLLDSQVRRGTSLEKFGAAAYAYLADADVLLNKWRRILGRDYLSIRSGIKQRLKGAQQYIRSFESVAAQYARNRGFDGIVCGHIHRPNLRRIDGCLYANDGDWVEHGTALAEAVDGSLSLLRWHSDAVTIAFEYDEGVHSLAA